MAVMRWVGRCGLALGLLLGGTGCGPELAPLPEVRLEGFAEDLSDRLGQALRTLAEDPRNVSAAGSVGMLLLAHEQHDLAVAYFDRARTLDPGVLRWEYYRGVSLGRLGRHLEAADSFRRCTEIDAGFQPAFRQLARSLLDGNDIEGSLAQYRGLAAESPADARAWYGLGRAEAAAGNSAAARDDLLEAVRLAPDYGAAHYALAQAYAQLGMADKARRHLARYESDRDAEPASDDRLLDEVHSLRASAAEYLRRGVEAKEQGRAEAAVDLHNRALREDPELVQARVNLVILYGSMGQPRKAEEQYRLALKTGRATAELHYNFGVLAYQLDRTGEAREAFGQALEINPDHALANHNMGQLLEEEGRYGEALARYQRALANRPNHGLSHYKIGMLRMRERRALEAADSFREAARERSDRRSTYLFSLAAALLASGDREGAVGMFRRARAEAIDHGQPGLVERIDNALQRMGAGSGGV